MNHPALVALLRERDHYLRRGLPERAEQVSAMLTRIGYVEPSTPDPGLADAPETATLTPALETATPPRPRGRPRKETK